MSSPLQITFMKSMWVVFKTVVECSVVFGMMWVLIKGGEKLATVLPAIYISWGGRILVAGGIFLVGSLVVYVNGNASTTYKQL